MLEFLNSGILALAASAAIPILIYLFVIKRPKRVVFSSLKHIKASQKRQKSKIKLKNIHLLILRCLIILIAILAIARPALKIPMLHRFSRHSQTAVAIILDTSYSMDYLVDTRSELEIGKEMIRDISSMLTDRDIVYLYTYDRQWNRLYSTQYAGGIPDHILATIDVTPQPMPVEDIIANATKRLYDSHILNREIHIITDMREQNYPLDNDIPILLIPTSDTEDRINISVRNAMIEEDFVRHKLEKSIRFEIVNHSTLNQSGIVCQLYVNGRTLAEKVTDLQPNQRKIESFTIPVDEPGWYYGYVSARNERLPYDARNYFSFYIPADISVAVISKGDNIPLPLISILEIYVKNSRNIVQITDDNLNYERFAQSSFVIVDTERALTPRLRFIIERLIDDNKGVLHIMSKNTDTSWQSYFSERFRLELNSYQEDVSKRISYINIHHPVMKIFSDEGEEPIEVNSYWLSRLRGDVNTLLQADQVPFVVENNREVIWLFDIKDIRNRILLDPIFPVMAYRTFLYCSYNDAPAHQVGERVHLPLNRIILPNGETIESNEPYHILSTNGIYEVPITNTRKKYLAVNIDYSPSEYRRMEPVDERKLVTLSDDWENNVLRSRYGMEIWKYLFILALLIVAIEMFLVKKEEKAG